ncbi:hypothetical protein FO519_009039 [Halicephalobus sp. NKZ332]|nr:hypothetical protein FO519_009039 [Halicephalobus sp. NKZ332]
MVRVHSDAPKIEPIRVVEFDPESVEYYPTSCCEVLHVRNAVLASTVLQIFFCFLLGFLYFYLDNSGFLRAVNICRMSMILLFFCNAIGLLCALFGILQEKIFLIHFQTMILTSLVVVADLMALCLVLIMAIGKKNYTTASIPGVFIDTDKIEFVLGPFWIYLVAIMLHMTAAATMCLIGVYNRYLKFLKSKKEYTRLSSMPNNPSTVPSTVSPTIVAVNNNE